MSEPIVRAVASPAELDDAYSFLLATFPQLETDWRGRHFFHDRFENERQMMVIALEDGTFVGAALGHVDGEGHGTVDHLAVRDDIRGSGVGRRLLYLLEEGARELGVSHLSLGSLDSAVGFYEEVGFAGKLLIQFTEGGSRDDVRDLYADFDVHETEWRGLPQLWVQTPAVDLALVDRVRGRNGVHAQWIMEKAVAPGDPLKAGS